MSPHCTPKKARAPRPLRWLATALWVICTVRPAACATGGEGFQQSVVLTHRSNTQWILQDVNGDGLSDLLTLNARRLQVFGQGPRGFAAEPIEGPRLPESVCALGVGLAGLPGTDPGSAALVALTPDALLALIQRDGRFLGKPVRLADIDTIFRQPKRVLRFVDMVLDLDGDGRDEVVVPTPAGIAIFALRSAAGLELRQMLPLPRLSGWQVHRDWWWVPGDSLPRQRVPLLGYENSVKMAFQDWDRDGKLDLQTGWDDHMTGQAVRWIFIQQRQGTFPSRPTLTRTWPLHADRTEVLCDLEGDGEPELVSASHVPDRWLPLMVLAPETQSTYVYRSARGDRFAAAPTHRLASSLFGYSTRLEDWNRDGCLDGVTFRLESRMTSKEPLLQAMVHARLLCRVAFHLSDRGLIPERPTFQKTLPYSQHPTRLSGAPELTTHADFDGDGLPDLAARTAAGRVEVYRHTPAGLAAEPSLLLTMPANSRMVVPGDLNRDGAADVILIGQVQRRQQLTLLLSVR